MSPDLLDPFGEHPRHWPIGPPPTRMAKVTVRVELDGALVGEWTENTPTGGSPVGSARGDAVVRLLIVTARAVRFLQPEAKAVIDKYGAEVAALLTASGLLP